MHDWSFLPFLSIVSWKWKSLIQKWILLTTSLQVFFLKILADVEKESQRGGGKAYIPMQRKTFCNGGLRWTIPPTQNFALGIPTCWFLKMVKFVLSPMQTLKFALPPTWNHNASQWSIGCIGFPGAGAHVGHVHFMLFVSILFTLGSQCKRIFQWNMGFTDFIHSQKLIDRSARACMK